MDVWTLSFQRRIAAQFTRGALMLPTVDGCGWEVLFRPESGHPSSAPIGRLARVFDLYVTEAGRDVTPALDSLDMLVARYAETLPDAIRASVREEWEIVRALEDVLDPTFVEAEVALRLERQRLMQTLTQAVEEIDRAGGDVARTYEILEHGLAARDVGAAFVQASLLRETSARTAQWARGDDHEERVPTGLVRLDELLGGGPKRGQAFYLLAPPKGAKTTVLTNIALGASRARKGVVFVSYEMTLRAMMDRFDRVLSHASRKELRENPSRLGRAAHGYIAAGAGDVWVVEAPTQQRGAVDAIERYVDGKRALGEVVDAVCFDFLNIMGGGGVQEEREKRHEFARVSREISKMAKNTDVVAWSATLCKREAINKRRINKDDIAESFEVIAVCDGAIALCANPVMQTIGQRALWCAALRDEEDLREAGVYTFDFKRMTMQLVDQAIDTYTKLIEWKEHVGQTVTPEELAGAVQEQMKWQKLAKKSAKESE